MKKSFSALSVESGRDTVCSWHPNVSVTVEQRSATDENIAYLTTPTTIGSCRPVPVRRTSTTVPFSFMASASTSVQWLNASHATPGQVSATSIAAVPAPPALSFIDTTAPASMTSPPMNLAACSVLSINGSPLLGPDEHPDAAGWPLCFDFPDPDPPAFRHTVAADRNRLQTKVSEEKKKDDHQRHSPPRPSNDPRYQCGDRVSWGAVGAAMAHHSSARSSAPPSHQHEGSPSPRPAPPAPLLPAPALTAAPDASSKRSTNFSSMTSRVSPLQLCRWNRGQGDLSSPPPQSPQAAGLYSSSAVCFRSAADPHNGIGEVEGTDEENGINLDRLRPVHPVHCITGNTFIHDIHHDDDDEGDSPPPLTLSLSISSPAMSFCASAYYHSHPSWTTFLGMSADVLVRRFNEEDNKEFGVPVAAAAAPALTPPPSSFSECPHDPLSSQWRGRGSRNASPREARIRVCEALEDCAYFGVYFGADWCPQSKAFIPILKQFYEKHHKAKNFEMVYFSRERSEEALECSVREAGLEQWWCLPLTYTQTHWPVVKRQYQMIGIPTLLIFRNMAYNPTLTIDTATGEETGGMARTDHVGDAAGGEPELGGGSPNGLRVRGPRPMSPSMRYAPPSRPAAPPQLISAHGRFMVEADPEALHFPWSNMDKLVGLPPR